MAEPSDPGANNPAPEPENNPTPAPTPPEGNEGWKARAEDLQKQLDNVTQERNLLRNRINKNDTDNKAAIDKLRAEKEDALSKLSALETEKETSQKQQAVDTKKSEILKEYPDGVRELADDLGVELSDAEDPEAIKGFTAKLDKIKERVESTAGEHPEPTPPPRKQPKVNSNNSSLENNTPPQKTDEQEMEELADKLKDVKF